jgi:hypothetical protein
MPFTERQRTKVMAWFERTGVLRDVCVCGSISWAITEEMLAMLSADENGNLNLQLGAITMLLVVVQCLNCGLTRQYDAAALGLP